MKNSVSAPLNPLTVLKGPWTDNQNYSWAIQGSWINFEVASLVGILKSNAGGFYFPMVDASIHWHELRIQEAHSLSKLPREIPIPVFWSAIPLDGNTEEASFDPM